MFFSFTAGTCGTAADWLGPGLNSSFLAGHSELCFSCNFGRDAGHCSCQGFLVRA